MKIMKDPESAPYILAQKHDNAILTKTGYTGGKVEFKGWRLKFQF